MAFGDTALKRASASIVAKPWRKAFVPQGGGFDQAERQTIGWTYSGILVGAAAAGFGMLLSSQRHRLVR